MVEGAAAGVSEELEESAGETEVVAAALEASALVEEDVEDVPVIRRDGFQLEGFILRGAQHAQHAQRGDGEA